MCNRQPRLCPSHEHIASRNGNCSVCTRCFVLSPRWVLCHAAAVRLCGWLQREEAARRLSRAWARDLRRPGCATGSRHLRTHRRNSRVAAKNAALCLCRCAGELHSRNLRRRRRRSRPGPIACVSSLLPAAPTTHRKTSPLIDRLGRSTFHPWCQRNTAVPKRRELKPLSSRARTIWNHLYLVPVAKHSDSAPGFAPQ